MTPSPSPTSVDFHFDVMCPYAYQTSLWMRSVRDQLDLDVRWRFFSLEEVNRAEGKKHPWEREWSYGWSMMRVGARLRREDPALLDEWYLRAGTALHVDGLKPHRREVAEHLVTRLRGGVTEHIATTMKAWDDRSLVRQIELSVGRDLQFIRLNGTLVGGAIGLLLHALKGWLQ